MKITREKDAWGGEYCAVSLAAPASFAEFPAERIPHMERFVCSFREEPFFMRPTAGDRVDEIPQETQWLGVRHKDGSYSVYFSLAFERYRTCFRGKEGRLWISASTGDEGVAEASFVAYYRISGRNFYELVAAAAQSLRRRFQTCRLRREKEKPECMRIFGWCTWDSFYDEVKAEDIPKGLESFRQGGIVPRLLILDDGWQTTSQHRLPRGQWKLSGLEANEKFAPALKNTVAAAKEMGVEKFFVWHAIGGYWGGMDPTAEAMKKYAPALSKGTHTQGIKALNPTRWEQESFAFGLAAPDRYGQFYEDYHSYLRSQGVDGVKVDVQSAMEAHGQGRGGSILMTRTLRQGLERAAQTHFRGEMINCMSNGNDVVYHCKDSNLMRSSGDFYPDRPASHREHIFHNAVNSIWLSPFVWCDWDMFQTNHPFGPYHGAARAISGSPVYVSDRVDGHDFDLIRRLTDGEGRLFLCNQVAMPTEDCLFRDPGKDGDPYKIFNTNDHNGVVGVFAFDEGKKRILVSPGDIPGCAEGSYACHCCCTGQNLLLRARDTLEITLENREFELVTIAPVTAGAAVLGLTNKLNGGAAVKGAVFAENALKCVAADGGELLLYSEKTVSRVTLEGKTVAFAQKDGFVTAQLPGGGKVCVEY